MKNTDFLTPAKEMFYGFNNSQTFLCQMAILRCLHKEMEKILNIAFTLITM